MSPKQLHLAAHFPGVNNTTVWSDPQSGSQIDFASFQHLAATAERGKFDFFFLADGQRLRENKGRIHELDVLGRPDGLTVLAGLAAVTDRLGLAATVNATYNEPHHLARRLASLDHLSGGRAGWNVVTTSDAFTGENFRRGAYLDHADRYRRAQEFVQVARKFWDSRSVDGQLAETVDHTGPQFRVRGVSSVPRSPQGHPVTIQAGDSAEGRDFAAADADVIFTRHGTLAAGQQFYADVKGRLAGFGRRRDDLKIMPGVTVVVADTDAEAEDLAASIRAAQVSGPTAIGLLELVWGRDLSGYDPDGPLPDVEPLVGTTVFQGRVYDKDPVAQVAAWREQAAANDWSIRQLVINNGSRQSFIGSADTVATAMNEFVQADAADGFILVPHLTPGGLDPFVDKVVPLLQERGVFRADYAGTTLRDHLGLGLPAGARADAGAA